MNDLNPLLTPSEQAHIDAVRALQHSPDGYRAHWLARIDWMRVFIVTARLLVSIGLLITAYQYFQYAMFFGAGAVAFIGQFLIGVFFAVVVFYTRDGLQILTAAAGMYLLTGSF